VDVEKPPVWLVVWLSLGVVWWLLGISVVPSSKHYHHGLMILSWLPGLIGLIRYDAVRRAWMQPLIVLLLALVLWSGASWFWSATPTPIGATKVFLYVLLAANGFLALAALSPRLFWQSMALSCLANGFLAFISVSYLYLWLASDWTTRAVGTGQLDHPILAAQAYMATAILLPFLKHHLPAELRSWAFYLSCSGYAVFLLMSQSRGPLLATVATALLMPLWISSRRALFVAGTAGTCIVVLAWLLPDLLLQRGLSYRPELLRLAWQQFMLHPIMGIGFDSPYLLHVVSAESTFKHAHNLYMHTAIRLGSVGLLLWLWMQLEAWRICWRTLPELEGQALSVLLCFAALAVFTDAPGLWVKPRAEWFCVWLPLFLALALPVARPEGQVGRRSCTPGLSQNGA
jgi:O-antigen ligase